MTYDDCDRPTAEKYRRDSDGRVVQTHSWTYYPFGSSAPAGSRGLLQSETVWEIPQSMSANQNSLVYCTRNYSYDSEGRVTGISESWSDGWTSNVSTTYDFVGNVTSVIESHSGPGGYSQTISTSYTYDQRGRKLTSSRSVSGDETGDMTLASVTYTYDELGRPSGKTVVGSNGSTLIDEDIDLDIHGWTKSITAKSNSTSSFFSEVLSYANPSRGISTPRYDGNISEISSVHNVTPANGSSVAIYSYNYDGMKRLADARHTGISTLLTESNKNTERYISYDRNGNITGLTRYDSDGNADAITFSHTGNRMTSVNGNSYSYDSAGNMIHDGRKGLDISYNCLNLPSHAATADGSSLTYTYLADGTKMLVTNSGRGLRYIGSFTYSVAGANNFALESIACDEGRFALVSGGTSSPASLKDLFFVTDHLGNVRSIADVSPGLTAPVILEQNDYLPFGTKVQNSSYANVTENRYRYANKEEQSIGGINLSLLDFGARYYDPYVARWTSVDPMASQYLRKTPFGYCGDNPMNRIDPDGTTDYFSYSGIHLYNDGRDNGSIRVIKMEDYSRIVAQHDDSTADKEMLKIASLIKYSKTFSEAIQGGMTIPNALNVYRFYNTTGEDILYSPFGGNMTFNIVGTEHYITISVMDNAKNDLFNNSHNISNALNGHEGYHAEQYRKSGFSVRKYLMTPETDRELDAISAQRNHPTWPKTSHAFKDRVKRYETQFKRKQ